MDRADSDLVAFARDGAVAWLTLNRVDARNALNTSVLLSLESRLTMLRDDLDVRAIVITGAGDRAFSAGADLVELRGLGGVEARRVLGTGQRVFRQLETIGIPTIAAVRGWALGGGFELALACSLIVAATSARFGLPEAGLGLMPGYGGTQRLTRVVGAKVALAVMLTGEPIDAGRAWELGLLVRPPVEADVLAETATEVARLVASRSPTATRLILEAVEGAAPPDDGLRHEAALAALAVSSPDAAEGVAAFLEKREPAFRPEPR